MHISNWSFYLTSFKTVDISWATTYSFWVPMLYILSFPSPFHSCHSSSLSFLVPSHFPVFNKLSKCISVHSDSNLPLTNAIEISDGDNTQCVHPFISKNAGKKALFRASNFISKTKKKSTWHGTSQQSQLPFARPSGNTLCRAVGVKMPAGLWFFALAWWKYFCSQFLLHHAPRCTEYYPMGTVDGSWGMSTFW